MTPREIRTNAGAAFVAASQSKPSVIAASQPSAPRKNETYTEDLTMKRMQTQTVTIYTEAKTNHNMFLN